jgi:hypothetical protein
LIECSCSGANRKCAGRTTQLRNSLQHFVAKTKDSSASSCDRRAEQLPDHEDEPGGRFTDPLIKLESRGRTTPSESVATARRRLQVFHMARIHGVLALQMSVEKEESGWIAAVLCQELPNEASMEISLTPQERPNDSLYSIDQMNDRGRSIL